MRVCMLFLGWGVGVDLYFNSRYDSGLQSYSVVIVS